MAVLGNQGHTLLTGLSDFWQRFFADSGVLNSLYEATEVQLGQAYLDILSNVLNANLQTTPLFHKEMWHLFLLREDKLKEVPGQAARFRYPLDPQLKEFFFLQNRVYDPTVALEVHLDFEIEDDVIAFYKNPFESQQGIAARTVPIVQASYRKDRGGMYDPASPSVFATTGICSEGYGGSCVTTYRFRAETQVFNAESVGKELHMSIANTPHSAVVTHVLSETDILFEPAIAAPIPASEKVRWALYDPYVFTSIDVGNTILVTDPSDHKKEYERKIKAVIDGYTVEIDVPLPFQSIQTRVPWEHMSPDAVTELSFWIPDALFDREDLYLSFGYLVDRYEPSSENYRALLEGIFRYFMLGPAMTRIESALNVMVGIPVVREDGEVVQEVGESTVRTDQRTYDIPAGSLRTEIQVGTKLRAFQSLTTVFQVRDYVSDPLWYMNRVIPETVVENETENRRTANPQLFSLRIGDSRLRVGDPGFYVGADGDGHVLQNRKGKDGFVSTTAPEEFYSLESKFFPYDKGKYLQVEGALVSIEDVGHGPYGFVTNTTIPQPAWALNVRSFNDATAVLNTNMLRIPSIRFEYPKDVGRALLLDSAYYIIDEIVDTHTVLVVTYPTRTKPAFGVIRGQGVLAKDWEVITRRALIHSVGYTYIRNYLKQHLFDVSYELGKYPTIPYPRSEEDIQSILMEGKSGYVTMLLNPNNVMKDAVGILDHLITLFGVSATTELFQEKDPSLAIDGTWEVGTYYYQAGPDVAWYDVIREDSFDVITPLQQPDGMETVVFSASISDDWSAVVTLDIYAEVGGVWTFTGDSYVISEGGNVYAHAVQGQRLAVLATMYGTPTRYALTYGYIPEQPTVIRNVPPTAPHSTSGTTNGIQSFIDMNFYFNEADLNREIVFKHSHEASPKTYTIAAVLSSHEVMLRSTDTALIVDVPVDTGISWWLGAPRSTANNATIGGANITVEKQPAGNYIIDWPLSVTIQKSRNRWVGTSRTSFVVTTHTQNVRLHGKASTGAVFNPISYHHDTAQMHGSMKTKARFQPRLRAVGSMISGYHPENYLAYYDATAADTLYKNADFGAHAVLEVDPVGRWVDRRGNALADLRRSTGTHTPRKSSFGGASTVYFDGNDVMQSLNGSILNEAENITVVAIVTPSEERPEATLWVATTVTGDAPRARLALSGKSGRVEGRGQDGDVTTYASTGELLSTMCVIGEYDFAQGTLTVQSAGQETTVSLAIAGKTPPTNSDTISVGGWHNRISSGDPQYYRGHIHRLILFNRVLSEKEKRQLSLYGRVAVENAGLKGRAVFKPS